jgi:hypothetical protein
MGVHDRPRDLIVTTSWDDGQKADLKLAGLLAKYNIKGTFYVTQTYRHPLEKEEVLKIGEEHEIGSHTLNHPHLPDLALSDAKREIEGSKEYLEKTLRRKIKMFSYPYGEYNDDIAGLVKNAGYAGARTCNMGHFGRPDDLYKWQVTLPSCSRIGVGKLLKCSGVYTRSLHCLVDPGFFKKEFLNIILNRKLDWGTCAIKFFAIALKSGGIYHLWGHAHELETMGEWDKLERVFKHISNKKGVRYMTNGEVFDSFTGTS